MNRSLLAVSAALVVMFGWHIVLSLAQDDGIAADTPGEQAPAPAAGEPVTAPDEPSNPDAVAPARSASPSDAGGPLAGDVAAPAETPKPESVKPAEEVKPSDTPKTKAGKVKSVEPAPAVVKPLEPKPEQFDLDRTPQSTAADEPARTTQVGKKARKQDEKRESFWSRMFGKGSDKDEIKTPAGESLKVKSAPDGKPSEPAWAPLVTPAEPKPAEAIVPSAAKGPLAGDVAAPAAQVEKKPATQEEMLAVQEEVRRQAKEIEGLKNLDLAYQAMSRNEFDEALRLFNMAMGAMPVRPHTVETRNKARMAQAQCEYRIALNNYQLGSLAEARQAANRVLGYAPTHREAMRLIERISRTESKKVTTKPTPIRFSKEHLDKEQGMNNALKRGKQYMAVHEYEKAIYEFNSVLIEDAGNEEANANLKKIAEGDYKRETYQYDRMQKEMIAQVRDTWTAPVKQEVNQQFKPMDPTLVIPQEKQRLVKKLNTIIIPELSFRQANIVDVIKYLDQQSIIADKESGAGDKGVNIILNLKRPGQAGAAAAPAGGEADIFGAEGQVGGMAASSSIPPVTLTLRNIVLLDAIKFITEVTGLKFRIESNVVIITPADVVVGEVMTRTYRVQPNMGDIIGGSMVAGAGAGAGDGIGVGFAPAATERGGDVKKFFVEAGVPFPDGTSIKYQPSLNLLIVANTAENLEKFEQILAKLNVIPVQVEIEARFVEVAQTDLEELGVEWLLSDNWIVAQDASAGAAVPLSARERIQVNRNSFTKGLRDFDSTLSPIAGGNMAGILSISSILTNPELSFILHALEQRSGANLLSAPKVTTKSGANAEIKVVKELIYPTEFEQSTQTAGQAGGGVIGGVAMTQVVVTPGGFQTRDTGVILSVTPVVGPDGFTIDLTMMPQVVELAEWIDYGSTVIDPGGITRRLPMPQPIFHSRSIATSISIWDGQTVVMGGLITEQQTTTLDKVPFLGDIPLIGYLFQSKTSNSVKRNLLIFVTANLVDPAGNKINKAPVNLVGVASSSQAATP